MILGHWDHIARMQIGRAGYNLERLAFADIYLADDQLVRIGVWFNRQDFADDDILDFFAFDFPAFYLRAGQRHPFGEFPRLYL